MKGFLISILCVVLFVSGLRAQSIIIRDGEIEQMTQQVSRTSLRSYVDTLVSFGTRHTMSSQTERNGIGAAREWVLAKFKSFEKKAGGRLTTYIDKFVVKADGKRIGRDVVLGNVMAELKGTDPNDKRVFVVSAHLDSRRADVMDSVGIAPGANDDGSGVAALIECVRVMSEQEFSATIIFVAVSGEEQGLFGAEHLAERARGENWQVEAVLNDDMLGSNVTSETGIVGNTLLRVFSEGIPIAASARELRRIRQLGLENDSPSRQLARYVKEVGERYVDNLNVALVYRSDRFLRGGDHTPFLEKGFAAVRLTEMNENYDRQHQDAVREKDKLFGDLPEFVDYEYLRKNVALNVAVLANLAKAPSVPLKVSMNVTDLTNETSLLWKASEVGNVVGYYVLLRDTSSPVWQRKLFTTDTSITLPYSKDNYIFAVQSVNSSGNESLPVVARPM